MCWCLVGAIYRCHGEQAGDADPVTKLAKIITRHGGSHHPNNVAIIVYWQDKQEWPAVKRVLDEYARAA